MNKIFCFDIDGTLRDNVNHEVSSSTKLALDTLKEMGYKLIISTGRAYDSLKRTKINELIDWDGFVLNNGQLLLDHNENVIEEKAFDPSTVIEVIKRADELNYAVTLKKEKRTITKEPDEYVKTTQAYSNNVIGPVEKYDGHEDVCAMIIYGPMGYQKQKDASILWIIFNQKDMLHLEILKMILRCSSTQIFQYVWAMAMSRQRNALTILQMILTMMGYCTPFNILIGLRSRL